MGIEQLEHVRFHGVLGGKNVSGLSFQGDRAMIVVDELTDQGNVLQIFEPNGSDYSAMPDGVIVLDVPGAKVGEMDLEGVAVDGPYVYVMGSHSAKRAKVDETKSHQKNRDALTATPKPQPDRDVLLKCEVDAAGKAIGIERTSLRPFLDKTEPFRSYSQIASKENGVDIEGLAVRESKLYIGFRGPVLRGNFTPIVRCQFADPVTDPEILFVDLGGRGIRELATVSEGMLILAGPVGDGPGTFQLYLWDGRDGVPGTDAPTTAAGPCLVFLGDLPLPETDAGEGGSRPKAEGLALIRESNHHWDVLIVFDGLKNGHGVHYQVAKPGA